jgi:hypothetical protein
MLGADVVTLCTGTRDAVNIWRAHRQPDTRRREPALMDYRDVFAQLDRVAPVVVIVQDAAEHDAAGIHIDLLRWAGQSG